MKNDIFLSYLSFALLFLLSPAGLSAEVRLPRLVGSGMMLQRDTPVELWGWADPGETLSLSLGRKVYTAGADSLGQWRIELPAQKAGGPHRITLRGSRTAGEIHLEDVLFGDIWLCSGQSNMETPVSRVMTRFGNEIKTYSNPHIRYVKVPAAYHFHGPQDDVGICKWEEVTPETAQNFSALPYFFAKEMYEKTGVPVGIINSSLGGSPVEAWIGEDALGDYPALLNDMRICRSDEFVAEMQRLAPLAGKRWNEVLNEQDTGRKEGWEMPDCNDEQWKSLDLFDTEWGRKGQRSRNGVHWFRKEVDIPSEMTNQDAMLYLGRIVDADYVYLNGQPVGFTSYQYPPRNYSLKAGMLKEGRNLIAVRLISQGGRPGFVKGKPYEIVAGEHRISLQGEWKYRLGAEMPSQEGGGVAFQNKPTGLYNAMIAPLKHFAFRGVIWYQGESNTGNYDAYYGLMSALIGQWRSLWNRGERLPFFIVQLPNFMEPAVVQPHSNWAELRDVQRELAQTIPNTHLAVAIDLGEANDIHPLNKKDLAHRIALQTRRVVYGEKIVSEGPVFESFEREGNRLILSFRENTNDLEPVDSLEGFALSGPDGVFHPAEALLDGNKVVVWCHSIDHPQAVCYAWADNPEGANLRNRQGLPASPFRTK
ncbi:MAG: sialate O-acetylesterase [Tannerellaceae bacterium]|jgi:sialate O-acetylesterase|nr:sialate O-acetylesterase [Tannerellaceae bacterium]